MAYDYNSRSKWEKAKIEEGDRIHKKKIDRLSKDKRELLDEVKNFSIYPHCGFPVIFRWGREKTKDAATGRTLKEILYEGCPEVIDILLLAEDQKIKDPYILRQITAGCYAL